MARKGASGAVFAAYVSTEAPAEIQLEVTRQAAEIAKTLAGKACFGSTTVEEGASGLVALVIGNGMYSLVEIWDIA